MTSLGRYELLEKLGEGGMGAVWLGRLTGEGGFEKLCIIKTVLPAIAKDQQFVSRFLHEGRVLTQLQHSNIAQVFDMGREGDTLYLALEYVPGVDLSNLSLHLRNQQQDFPLPVAVYLIQQVAEGLGFAHRKTSAAGSPLLIVHRDVSPQNVMISFEGEVKVIDFGIAKSEGRSHATATASVMGKLGYMAPEQARGEPVDARADQYACGVLLWELLTSTAFVPRGTMTEMVVAMANPVIRPLTPLRADVPASLEQVVLKALAADPARRFATTDDFAAALMTEQLRLAGLPTKRQIGEWVRANCPSDFQANQALLTRISLSKATVTDDGSTFVRTPTAPPSAERPSGSTAELAKLAVPGTKAPLIIGGVLVLALGLAAVLFVLSRNGPAPSTSAAVTLISAPRVVEVFDDQSKVFVRAGTAQGLRVGESVALVGAAQADGRRPLLGQATVIEVFNDLARVNPGQLTQRPLFASVGEPRPAAPPAVVAAPVAEVIEPLPPPPDSVETATLASPGDGVAADAGLGESPLVEAQVSPLSFSGRVTIEGHVIVSYRGAQKLTGCVLILSRQRVAKLGVVSPRAGLELLPSRFAVDSSAAQVADRSALVKCNQGQGALRF